MSGNHLSNSLPHRGLLSITLEVALHRTSQILSEMSLHLITCMVVTPSLSRETSVLV